MTKLADDPHFRLDPNLIRSLHYMMLSHDVHKSPGRYRLNSVFVVDESRDKVVYEGPDALRVPQLCEELAQSLAESTGEPSFVRAAMAHLNLVMIRPFRDGNGRMARCLQTLILARDSIVAPEFSSVEEFLGRNTPDPTPSNPNHHPRKSGRDGPIWGCVRPVGNGRGVLADVEVVSSRRAS